MKFSRAAGESAFDRKCKGQASSSCGGEGGGEWGRSREGASTCLFALLSSRVSAEM